MYLALQPEILHNHLVPFVFFVGLINAFSVGQMITAHLVKAEFPYNNILIAPLVLGVVDSLGPWLTEHVGWGWPSALGGGVYQVAFVFCCLGLGIGVYGSFVVSLMDRAIIEERTDIIQVDVIVTICDYLDIWCLTIKHPYNEKDGQKKVK